MIRGRRLLSLVTIGAAVAMAAAGCVSSGGGGGAVGARRLRRNGWATATSAQAGGGMDALVAAAKKEGTLNVIALPPDWANYGAIIKAFSTKYGITVNSANPEGSSQDEINAVKQLGTQDRAPDVLDLGQSFANEQHRPVRAVPGRHVGLDPRGQQGRERRLGQRLRRLHLDRLQRQAGRRPAPRRSPTWPSPSTRARSRSTATRRRPRRRSPGSGRRRWPTAARSTTSRRA